jgi:molybdate transport repressor ModE-like protein
MPASPRLVHRTGAVDGPRYRRFRGAGAGPFDNPPGVAPPSEPGTTGLPLPLPEPNETDLSEAMQEVMMENVRPLRLKLLLEIERTGSISQAAEACMIRQPSASAHLRTLESAIGHQLVARGGRGSKLTAAGQIVAAHAMQVLATLDSMRVALEALDTRNGGELTLAASLMPSVVLIPALLRQFSDSHPDATVKLRTAPSATVVREVARGIAEIGIAGEFATPERVVRRQITLDELVGIASPELVSPDAGWISPGAFARNNLLVGDEQSSTRMVIERHLARAGYSPAAVSVFDSSEAIKHAVAEGFGVSFLSRELVSEDVQRGKLIAFRVAGLGSIRRTIHLVQSGDRQPTPEATAFAALLAEGCGDRTVVDGPAGSHPRRVWSSLG